MGALDSGRLRQESYERMRREPRTPGEEALLALLRGPASPARGVLARLELALLDPQVARELGIVAAHLLDERSASSRRMNTSSREAEREVG